MGLRSLMSNLATAAFAAAGDVPQSGVLRCTPTHTYAPGSDTTTSTWAYEDPITIILYDADRTVDVPIGLGPVTDRRTGLIRLAQATGTINPGDQIETAGELWHIFGVEPDPAGATATLHLWQGAQGTTGITTEAGDQITTEDGQEVVA